MLPLSGPRRLPICAVGGRAGEVHPGGVGGPSHSPVQLFPPPLLLGSVQGRPPLCAPLPNPCAPRHHCPCGWPPFGCCSGPRGLCSLVTGALASLLRGGDVFRICFF